MYLQHGVEVTVAEQDTKFPFFKISFQARESAGKNKAIGYKDITNYRNIPEQTIRSHAPMPS